MKKYLLFPLFALLLLAMAPQKSWAANDDVTVVLTADFTQFTQGSMENPVDFPSYGTGSFTSYFSGWYASKVAQAGGQLLIKDGGYVQSNGVSCTANGGTVRLSTKVKMRDSYGGILKISVGYSASRSLMITDSLWRDVQVVLTGGSYSTKFQIEPMLSASGVLVRSLTAEQSPAFIATPTAQYPSQADGLSFTARWNSISGATSYLIDVYSYNGEQRVYKLQNHGVGKVTSYKVTDLDPATKYYYTVRATNGTGTSDPSEEIRVYKIVYSLQTPAHLNLTSNENYIAAQWDAVPDAETYVLSLDRIYKCPNDSLFEMINEPFDKITAGSLSSVEFIYRTDLSDFTHTIGWSGEELALAAGNMVLSPFGGANGWLSTPLVNLAGKDDTFAVDCELAQGAYGSYYAGGVARVSLINAIGDTIQTKNIELVKNFADYHLDFTGGTDSCRVAISYNGDYKLFIDAIKVSQLKAKDSRVQTFLTDVTTAETSTHVDIPREDRVKISGRIVAAVETVSVGDVTMIYSEPSKAVVVSHETNGVEGVNAGDLNADITVVNGDITITLGSDAPVAVADLSGRTLFVGKLTAGTTTLPVKASGITILRIGTTIYKVLAR